MASSCGDCVLKLLHRFPHAQLPCPAAPAGQAGQAASGEQLCCCCIACSCALPFLSLQHLQVKLAKRLVESSFADRVFYANTGTEANEAAIKFARKHAKVQGEHGKLLVYAQQHSSDMHCVTPGC